MKLLTYMNVYENVRRVVYDEGATFVPVCERCGRFVKKDDAIFYHEIRGLFLEPNATCAKCGRTHMLFEGWWI